MTSSAAHRFDKRVDDYARGRPAYPQALYDWIFSWLRPATVVADLGSGTGIFCAPLLEAGFEVYGVEPGDEMRAIAKRDVGNSPFFHSVDGTAERTGLDTASIDLATAAQSFHWFDFQRVRSELQRIARPRAHALIVWNNRDTDGSELARRYESMLHEWGTDYDQVSERWRVQERLGDLFPDGQVEHRTFANHQDVDLSGLRARIVSSSYMPGPDHPRHDALMAAAETLFDEFETDGRLRMDYHTDGYLGRIC